MPNRFTKIGADGAALPDDAPEWEAVFDNRTGLMWTKDDVQVSSWSKAADAASGMKASGFEDWRLPTVEGLFLLADRTRARPAIDTAFFPDCQSDWYWTGTVYAQSPGGYAWGVGFDNGYADCYDLDYYGFVRAVRAGQ